MIASIHGAAIMPIAVVHNDKVGLTLWPPWRDRADGETWQGPLGVRDTILLFPSATALKAFLDTGTANDLTDHPAWASVAGRTVSELRATPEYTFDLDSMFDLVAGDPTSEALAEASKLLYLVSAVADCCGDDRIYDLVTNDAGFAPFTASRLPADPAAIEADWNRLGASTLHNWDEVIAALTHWSAFEGDFDHIDPDTIRVPVPFTAPWANQAPEYVPAAYRPTENPGTSSLAVVAFVFVLLGIFVLAILCGHSARNDIRFTGKTGDGLAVAALVIGYLELAGLIIVGAAIFFATR